MSSYGGGAGSVGITGTAVDPTGPAGVIIDPTTELAGSPALGEVIQGDGLGGWAIGPVPTGPTWKELVLVREQLLDGASAGILQAILAKMGTNPTAADTFDPVMLPVADTVTPCA